MEYIGSRKLNLPFCRGPRRRFFSKMDIELSPSFIYNIWYGVLYEGLSAVQVLVIGWTVFEENGIFGKIGRARLSTLKDFMFIFSFSAADWSRTKSFKCSMSTLLQKRMLNSRFETLLDFIIFQKCWWQKRRNLPMKLSTISILAYIGPHWCCWEN